MLVNLIRSIGGVAACGYLLLLAARGQLGTYLHPRYHLFTATIAAIGLILLLIDIILQLRRRKKTHAAATSHRLSLLSWITLIVLLLGYLWWWR